MALEFDCLVHALINCFLNQTSANDLSCFIFIFEYQIIYELNILIGAKPKRKYLWEVHIDFWEVQSTWVSKSLLSYLFDCKPCRAL